MFQNGKLHLDDDYKGAYLKYALDHEGKRGEMTIAIESKTNSKPQQRYYRGVIVKMLAEEIGESVDRMHQILAAKFFVYVDNNGRSYVRSTEIGEWTTIEWEEKMREIRSWAWDFLNLNIPEPNQIEGY